MLIVVALGGNAVSLPNTEGNIPEQYAATRNATRPLVDLILAGHQLVITHGNGPQIGQIMRRVEIAAQHHIYPLPLDTAVADTQAGMGYMIGQCLMNELALRGQPRLCTTIVTTVRIDESDLAFQNPSKPIGPFMSKESADRHAAQDKWIIAEDPARGGGGGWRRVVASPLPREIIELPIIKTLIAANHLIVVAGGGGIPVTRDARGNYKGIEAVIDKDRTSALLATELNADMLAILTNVDQVQLDFGKPSARPLAKMSVPEAHRFMKMNQFSEGSMLPKVQAAVDFLTQSPNPSAQALITSCERFHEAFDGITGTRVVRSLSKLTGAN